LFVLEPGKSDQPIAANADIQEPKCLQNYLFVTEKSSLSLHTSHITHIGLLTTTSLPKQSRL